MKTNLKALGIGLLFIILSSFVSKAENGYELWLRYHKIQNQQLYAQYRKALHEVLFVGQSPTLDAIRHELHEGFTGLLQLKPAETKQVKMDGTLIVGTPATSAIVAGLLKGSTTLGKEGYFIRSMSIDGKSCIVLGASTEHGLLYGSFRLLKLLQTGESLSMLDIKDKPKIKVRILNHWDNLTRTVERGYAGSSIWNWHKLPDYIDPRYIDYARANASVGINGTVVNNVNANALSLTKEYLSKTAALAKVFRPYGIKLYLSARFSAPVEIGGLKTADPLDPLVQKWWKDKADEIYGLIPDFGGFLVKANSEGQPGPQTYGRSHADGANLLADALKPHGGIVMWRAFVYDDKNKEDRAKQAYSEFRPLDGKFNDNVIVQVKNGAVDFQPREPFHPLFGTMTKTPVMIEFQVTQEYLGFSTHLAYLGPLFKECLDSDTFSSGKGSTVAKIIEGKDDEALTGMAGVANIGSDINWCGHPFAQSNWYAFGRLAWNPDLSSSDIADEWLKMTFTNDGTFTAKAKKMMLDSRESVVNYMTPLGLHHLMGTSAHYGPAPWVNNLSRPDWNPAYYHKADSMGIGFDRSSSGSDAVSQYFPVVRDMFNNKQTVPQKYLLWFHHIPWTYRLQGGSTLWDELVSHYYEGVDSVKQMRRTWSSLKGKIDSVRYEEVRQLLAIQEKEAVWWRDACVVYFQSISKLPIQKRFPQPEHTLEYYQNLKFSYLPGTGAY
jgi:alpha-glucuronidase